jgi:hypothetical protein
MFRQSLAASALFVVLASVPALAQDVTDYLGVPGPITIGDTDYLLAWSSQPSEDYFKQEYLPAGARPETYESMVLVEFVATDLALTDVVAAQTGMITDRKAASDPIANFAVFNNSDGSEILLDFVLSSRDASGEYIIEWNGYRYAQAEHDGQSGAMVFGLSERAYGNANSEAFLRGLTEFKTGKIVDLTNAPMPDLN